MVRNKKLILIAVLVLVVVAGVAAAMVIGNRKSEDDAKKAVDTAKQDKQNALLGETFTDSQAGVTMRIPKEWQLEPKSEEGQGSLTKFRHAGTRANGELLARQSTMSMDQVVAGYLAARLDVDTNSELIKNETVTVGGKTGRLLIQDIPGPDGQVARVVQYIFNTKGTFYILSFTMLTTDWEAQRPSIEASAESLEIK